MTPILTCGRADLIESNNEMGPKFSGQERFKMGNEKAEHTLVPSVLGPEGNSSSSVCAPDLPLLLHLCGNNLNLVLSGFKTYLQKGT